MTPSQVERLLAAQQLIRYNDAMKAAHENVGTLNKEQAMELAQNGTLTDPSTAFWRDQAFEVLKNRIKRPSFMPEIDQVDRSALPDWLTPEVAAALVELKDYKGNLPQGVILSVANIWQPIKLLARKA